MSMPSAMTRRSEVKIGRTSSNPKKRKRQESQKRELPTRHSLLTDVAVADLEDEHTSKWGRSKQNLRVLPRRTG